ncbi:MAG: hypothetical protein L6461_03425 [Anaerolineae bacterium]|nr:hypothetical protein [Anaerolineae bacterium]
MKNVFTVIPQFLKNPQEFFESVQRNEELKTKAFSLFISTVVFLLIYGFITGLSHSLSQGLSTAVKMPILFLLTLAFTLPALYFFSLALLNIQFSVAQAGVVVLSGIGVAAFLLMGLSPVTLFFVLTSSNYSFFQLIAVLFVAVSGFAGLHYVLRGFTWVDKNQELTSNSVGKTLLRAWVVLYGFVGAQMTWRLSPLIGDPNEPFYLIRPSRDNFFADVINAFSNSFGLSRVDRAGSGFDFGELLFCGGIIIVIAVAVGAWLGKRQSPSQSIANQNVHQPEEVVEPVKKQGTDN